MNQIFEQIKTIDFDSSQYGKDLNERLQKIDSNFQKIITTDYLKGAPGENIAIYEWVIGKELEIELYQSFNDNQPWSNEDLYQNLQEVISNNYSSDSLIPLNSIHWYNDLIGSSIFLIYQTDQNDKKVIISSLPYIYIDSRFKHIGQPNFENDKYSELEDISCTIQFQTGLETGSGFKTIHNFPTIYYDAEISNGSLCWKINNKFTGIPCQGPKGKDGSNGQTYLAYIATQPDDNNLYEIYGVFGIQDNSYKIIPVEKFQDNNIQLKEGDSIICFFARDLGNGQYAPISLEEGVDKFTTYMISNVHVSVDQTTDQKYSVYGGEQICTVNTMANLTNFSTLLEEIGKTSGMLSCLFVPNLVNQNYHAFWSDNQENKFHLGQITDYMNSTNVNNEDAGTMQIHYSEIQCNEIDCSNIKSNTIKSINNGHGLIESDTINSGSIESDTIQSKSINSESIESDTINSGSIESDTIKGDNIICLENLKCRHLHILKTDNDNLIDPDIDITNLHDNDFYKLIDEIKKLNYIENFYTTWCVYDEKFIRENNINTQQPIEIDLAIHTHIISWYDSGDKDDDSYILYAEEIKNLMNEKNINHLKYHIINKSGQTMTVSIQESKTNPTLIEGITINKDEQEQAFIRFDYLNGVLKKPDYTVF